MLLMVVFRRTLPRVRELKRFEGATYTLLSPAGRTLPRVRELKHDQEGEARQAAESHPSQGA